MVAKKNIQQLTEQEVAAIGLQLTSHMNPESRQEVNCTHLGKQQQRQEGPQKEALDQPQGAHRNKKWGDITKAPGSYWSTTRTNPRRRRTAPNMRDDRFHLFKIHSLP